MTTALTGTLRAFIDEHDVGTLGVKRRDGTIHLSTVYHVREGDTILISTEPTRLKSRSIVREAWASYCIRGNERPYPSITVEGTARLLDEGLGEATTRLFTKIFGAPAKPMTDDEVRAINRTIIEITVTKVYAMSYLEA